MSCQICRRVKFGDYAVYPSPGNCLIMKPEIPFAAGHLVMAPRNHIVMPMRESFEDALLSLMGARTLSHIVMGFAHSQQADADIVIPHRDIGANVEEHFHAHYLPWGESGSVIEEFTSAIDSGLLRA